MPIFDLPMDQVVAQVLLIRQISNDLYELLKEESSDIMPSPSAAARINALRRTFIAQVLSISDISQSLASKAVLPDDIVGSGE